METLSIQQVAELKGCSDKYIYRLVKSGQLPASVEKNAQRRDVFTVALADLPEGLQTKYFRSQKKEEPLMPTSNPAPLDSYSADEREEIDFWAGLLEQWQDYRNRPTGRSKANTDKAFVLLQQLENPDLEISIDMLYRKQAALRRGDYGALVDMRGKWRRGITSMPEEIWQVFLTYYLDQSQHPIAKCMEYTRLYLAENNPSLCNQMPSYSTFRRRVEADLSESVRVMGREGTKAWQDRCSPYVRRTYDGMASNDYWVADNHTFDVQTLGKDGKVHRLYLTAFFDARSGIFTGCHVTDAPSSQATLIALRKGILKYGIPRNIYVDNGREFLTYDIGGRGHRAKKTLANGQAPFEPPGVFKRLGISMTNAIVRNAKAKVVERRFRDVKDHLSRLFETYTGGSVAEKPERLKEVLKDGVVPEDGHLIETVETLLEYYFNDQPYNGEVRADHGKKRIEVWQEHLVAQRKASLEDLHLMLMRTGRPQKVTRRGVKLEISGARIDYISDDLLTLQGKQVYLRYDPENLDNVRIYDMADRYLLPAPRDNTLVLPYGANKEDISAAMRQVRRAKKVTEEAVKYATLPLAARTGALELILMQANEAKATRIIPTGPKAIEMVRNDETPLLEAVGNISMADMTRAAQARRKREE